MKNSGIEALRMFGLYFVVIIHTHNAGLFGKDVVPGYMLDEMARFAVPCFFIISGYFWKADRMADVSAAALRILRRIGPIFLFWLVFYMAAEFSGLYDQTYRMKWSDYLIALFSGGPGYHLWFLPALIVGSVICWSLIRTFGASRALWTCAALYVVSVALGTYAPVFGPELPGFTYRNGIFEAPIFLMAGYLLQSVPTDIRRSSFLLLAVGGLALQLIEASVTGKFPGGHDFSFGTLPFAIGIFGLFRQSSFPVGNWGADVLGAYLVHLFLLRIIAKHMDVSGLAPALSVALCVTIVSLVMSRGLKRIVVTRPLVAT